MATARKNYPVTVGVFIVAGLTILAAGVFSLGRQNDLFTNAIVVKAYFTDVKGLQAGNNIHYEGVKVGIVKSVELTRNSKVEVVLKIEKKFIPYLYANAKAKIGADGLVGNKMVILTGGTKESLQLKENDVLVIEQSFSPEDIFVKLETTNSNIQAVTENLKLITGKIAKGKGSIGKLINDASMYGNLQAVIEKLNETAVHTKNFTLGIENYVAGFRKEGTLLNDLVTDTVIFARFQQASFNVQQLTEEIAVITQHLKSVSGNLTQSNSPAGIILNDKASAINLQQTLENLKLGSEKLNQDLEALKHNFLLRGYFKRQDKNKKNKNTTQQ